MRRDKKKKLARTFTIVTAVLLLFLFILRDVFRENWKDAHDSLAQAAALYEILYQENDIVMRSERQTFGDLDKKIRDFRLKFVIEDMSHKKPHFPNPPPAPDFAEVYWRTSAILVELREELYFVSELIDRLPSSATNFRKLRDESQVRVEQDFTSLLPPNTVPIDPPLEKLSQQERVEREEQRQRMSLDVYVAASDEQVKVLFLGAQTVMEAKRALEVMERRVRICSYAIYALGFVVLVLGIYAAIAGLKSEGNEANR